VPYCLLDLLLCTSSPIIIHSTDIHHHTRSPLHLLLLQFNFAWFLSLYIPFLLFALSRTSVGLHAPSFHVSIVIFAKGYCSLVWSPVLTVCMLLDINLPAPLFERGLSNGKFDIMAQTYTRLLSKNHLYVRVNRVSC
jgi:hypothetical protein